MKKLITILVVGSMFLACSESIETNKINNDDSGTDADSVIQLPEPQ